MLKQIPGTVVVRNLPHPPSPQTVIVILFDSSISFASLSNPELPPFLLSLEGRRMSIFWGGKVGMRGWAVELRNRQENPPENVQAGSQRWHVSLAFLDCFDSPRLEK